MKLEVDLPNKDTGFYSDKSSGKSYEAPDWYTTFFIFKNYKMTKLEFFTDGAFSAMRNAGGIGIVIVKNGEKIYEYSKTYYDTTNNKCELLAVITSLNAVSKPVDSIVIHSDSQYVIGCATLGWKRKKNIELWNKYDEVYKKASLFCSDIKFEWVKGHTKSSDFNESMNNLADKLAVEASHILP